MVVTTACAVQVRAAAVSSLARFGAIAPGLKDRIVTLLRRALHDNDDEVSSWNLSLQLVKGSSLPILASRL